MMVWVKREFFPSILSFGTIWEEICLGKRQRDYSRDRENGLDQFSNFRVHIHHLGIFLKDRFWLKRSAVDLHPAYLISSQVISVLLPMDRTVSSEGPEDHRQSHLNLVPYTVLLHSSVAEFCKRKQSESSYWGLN